MGSYLVNFSIYTMAMLGLIFFAIVVYKKFFQCGFSNSTKSKLLQIEESMTLSPRKTLYVVRAGQERFLIASDVDKTSLISKLEPGSRIQSDNSLSESFSGEDFSKESEPLDLVTALDKTQSSVEDLPRIVDFREKKSPSSEYNVLQNLVRKING